MDVVGTCSTQETQISRSNTLADVLCTLKNKVNSENINSLWPNDAILLHRPRPTFAQVMASHYRGQCWLAIYKILWHSSQSTAYLNTPNINPQIVFAFEIPATSHRDTELITMKQQQLYKPVVFLEDDVDLLVILQVHVASGIPFANMD